MSRKTLRKPHPQDRRSRVGVGRKRRLSVLLWTMEAGHRCVLSQRLPEVERYFQVRTGKKIRDYYYFLKILVLVWEQQTVE